jgi:DNA-binding response OmpR family regulator
MAKIVVVDDEPGITFIVKKVLSGEGHTVMEANSGLEGIKKIKEEKPELVLLDVMMPELDGWDTCKKIKENTETKDTLVAMLSAKSRDQDKVKSLDYALADWHIKKPIDRKRLTQTVNWLGY